MASPGEQLEDRDDHGEDAPHDVAGSTRDGSRGPTSGSSRPSVGSRAAIGERLTSGGVAGRIRVAMRISFRALSTDDLRGTVGESSSPSPPGYSGGARRRVLF